MPQGFFNWSKTASSNGNSDSSINMAEGMAPSAVNDSGRAIMARLAEYRDDTAGTLTTGGTSTAYTLTSNQVFSSLALMSGQSIRVKFHTANGATPTLNVDGLGAKSIVTVTGTAVAASDLLANGVYDLVYDNSSSEWILVSSVLAAAANLSVGGNLTVTGTTALNGNVAVNTNKVNITAASGNTAIAGTLDVTGATTVSSLTASGLFTGVSLGGDIIASQAEMEAAATTGKICTPARLHFHPGVAKVWGVATVSGGTPSLETGSYNTTSITDTGTGVMLVTIATDYSAVGKSSMFVTIEADGATGRFSCLANGGRAAASMLLQCTTDGATNADPASWQFVGFGDLA